MRYAWVMKVPRWSYRQKFLQSYRKADWRAPDASAPASSITLSLNDCEADLSILLVETNHQERASYASDADYCLAVLQSLCDHKDQNTLDLYRRTYFPAPAAADGIAF